MQRCLLTEDAAHEVGTTLILRSEVRVQHPLRCLNGRGGPRVLRHASSDVACQSLEGNFLERLLSEDLTNLSTLDHHLNLLLLRADKLEGTGIELI